MVRLVRQVLMVLALGTMLAFVAACNDDGGDDRGDGGVTPRATTPAARDFPVEVMRSDGTPLTIEAPPTRMVVLSPGHVEILFAIGAGDQIVAIDENTDYPPEATAIDAKLSGFEPSVEAIAGQDPDLVIVSFDADGIVQALDDLGIPVFFDDISSEITTIEGVFESILELGRITGHTNEAEQLVASLRARVDAVEQAVADVEQGPRFYHELDENFFSVGPGSFIGDVYARLKAQNIVTPAEGPYPQLTQEVIIERNPEYIFLADAEFGQTPDVVAARPGWDQIDAVRNDRIYPVDADIYSRPGPRIVDALEELAALLYPERFSNEEARTQCWACSVAA